MSKRAILSAALCFIALGTGAFGAPDTFEADVTAMISAALREAPSDFTNLATTHDPNSGSDLVAPFGPAFNRCEITYLSQSAGMPKALMCSFKLVADGDVAARHAEIERAATAAGLSSWSKISNDSGTQWTQNGQTVELDIGDAKGKKKLRQLYLGLIITPHLRYLPLGPSVARYLDAAMAGAPSEYNNIPAIRTDDNTFFDVAPVYGAAFPYCRKFMGSFECYTPDTADPPDMQLDAVKQAVTVALPSGFYLKNCGKNVGEEPVCNWTGPGKLSLLVIIEDGPKDSGFHHIRLWFDSQTDDN